MLAVMDIPDSSLEVLSFSDWFNKVVVQNTASLYRNL